MERTLILDCNDKVDQTVKVCGWVQTRRNHGKIAFIDLSDRSGLLQIVLSGESLVDLHPQDVVEVTGKVASRPEKLVNLELATGKIELQAESVKILSKAAELPFDMGQKDLDLQLPTLLDFRALTLRHPKVKQIFKVQEAVMDGFRKATQKIGCTEIFVPTISASATEGGAEVFRVNYYGHNAFLIQSPQLYKQMLVPVFERVAVASHVYRAEPSVTTRHLSEVVQIDCEIGFAEFPELLDLMEQVATDMIKYVAETHKESLKEFGVKPVAFGQIPRLTLREAQEVIFNQFGRDNRQEKDLTPQDEVEICKWALEKHNSDFVTITHFPTKKRAFYTKPDPKDPEYSLSYDLLFRGVEILSGSQRINDYQELVEVITERGMDPKNFELYLQAFKFGMPPEGGFSFGLERVTMHILELANVREASLFPRDMERVDIRLSTLKK